MDAHKLRFVRCARCLQLLVEYPSVPVYQCGGCGTVLRAKNQAVPVAQASLESDEQKNYTTSLNESPRSNKVISADEENVASSSERPNEDAADRSSSSSIENTNSTEITIQERTTSVADSVTLVGHQNEETLIDGDGDGDTQYPVHMAGEKDTGPSHSSILVEKVEKLDTSEDANGGKFDDSGTGEVSTLYQKSEFVQREERLPTYQGVHVESHEALIEELERSLSFSSDDVYFSDEEENSGLSDALRNQMGSRRFMLGSKTNDSSRTDPHGRLIEELEMSFSDAEEPMEQHAADRFHGNEHDKSPKTLGGESSHPFEENALNNGHLKSEQTFHQENTLIDIGNQGKEDIEDDIASCVNGSEHIVVASEDICVHGSEHIVVASEDIADKFNEKEHGIDLQFVDVENSEGSISSINDGNIQFKQSAEQDDLTAEGIQEREEGFMEDDNMTTCIHATDNLVFTTEDITGRIHDNEELTVDSTGENEGSHMDDDNAGNYVRVNEHVVATDEDNAERVCENEHNEVQQSLDTESANMCEGSISLFNADLIKSAQSFQPDELTADGSKQKEEYNMGDGNTTNCVQADHAAVTRFSSLPHKRTQCKLPSFNKNKEEMPYRHGVSQLRQGLSLDSEELKSIQNFIESQMDGTSGSLSSGSPSQMNLLHKTSNEFNDIVRLERLRKIDELRDQLSRLSSQKSLEKTYHKRDFEFQQQPNSYDVEQHLHRVDTDSIPSSCALESYYGHGRPPRYQLPNPFSPSHSYRDCHFGHAKTHLPHNYDTWEFNSYYQSSYAESTILDHESVKSIYKEQKRVVRKHILRPLSGASPFTICNGCFNLVQMPSDIYISKAKIGKMQCAKCSKVLVLSFAGVCQANAMISKDVAQQSTDYGTAECLSINGGYGGSFARTFSTQAGLGLATIQNSKKVSDTALHRLMGYDSATQLLRHSRVLEDGYDSFESMVPVSSRVSRRKKM